MEEAGRNLGADVSVEEDELELEELEDDDEVDMI